MTPEQLYEVANQVWAAFANRAGWPARIERADAIQEAVLRCWRYRDNHDAARASDRTYFSLVARHAISMKTRREPIPLMNDMGLPDFDGADPSPGHAAQVEHADDLPTHLRQVIDARICGRPDVYTARALGVSRQFIQQKHARAVDLLTASMVG